MSKSRIINIIIERDGLSKEEAKYLVEETREMIIEAASKGNYTECDQIIADQLGLEPDYIMDLL